MKIEQLVEQEVKSRKVDWNGNPKIGWLIEKSPVRLYYGTHKNAVHGIMKEGIYAGSDGYVLCAAEPNTAYLHAAMRCMLRENKYDSFSVPSKTRAIFVLDVPLRYLNEKHLLAEGDKAEYLKNKELYEEWGKSDVEYYSLIDVKIPEHIPVDFVKGYMIRNDS